MNRYGLTEAEKRTHLQQYNHALFRNSLSFMDIVWEINLLYDSIVILEDKGDPALRLRECPYMQFLNETLEARALPDERELLHAHMDLDRLREMREEASFDLHLRSHEGGMHLHRIVLTPALDENGRLYCVYLGALNLHEEEQRELMEYRNQEQFREAMLSGCYFHFDFDVTAGGMITEDAVARDGSHPIREATGMMPPVSYEFWLQKWYELYQPQYDQQEEKDLFSLEAYHRAFERNERLLSLEVMQRSPREPERVRFMHIFVILLENPADRHIRACVIWRDITPFRQGVLVDKIAMQAQNEALRRTVSEVEQFRQAALSGAILVYNINLTKNLIEDEFYEMVNGKRYPILQLVGLTPPCVFDTFCERWSEKKIVEDSRETFRKFYNRQYLLDAYERGERQLEIEFDTVIGRGIPITLRNTALLVKDDQTGDILAMINGKDITRQRASEREKRDALRAAYEAANRANAAKSDFLSRMSHDIRTPMNAIIGMTAIAGTHLDDRDRLHDCLNKITVASKHLLDLINEVLDMSKIESGKIDLQEAEFNLPDLVETTLELVRPQILARGHRLSVSIRNVTHEKVIGDMQRIQQVFVNLLSNAYKYTPDGGRIQLLITEKSTNQPMLGCYEFVVQDNGIGMTEEFQERIFAPFERSDDARALKEQGTGLGMAITQNIVQMMNGSIQVESHLNQGTRFTVTFYLRLQQTEAEATDEVLHGLPVLVVDDDEVACEMTSAVLCDMGMQAECVTNGETAVERVVNRHAQENDYYAVIMDWKMPGMDGVATTREIRKRIDTDIPIIILSAYDWSEIEPEARKAGANAFVSKPLFKSRLTYLFKTLLGGHEETRQKSSIEELEEENFNGFHALLAEDNELNAEIALEVFGSTGLQMERVVNGQEAYERIRNAENGEFDIVFMDVQMPVMNGYDAVRAIRALENDYARRVPIIAVTANAFAQDVQEAMASGMNGHIAKPLDFEQVHRMLNKWLRGKDTAGEGASQTF